MPPHPPAAFISYCRDDQEFALRLAQDLKAAGAAVWIDQIDIAPGVTWDNAIEDALLASPRMLLVLSPASSRSQNVRNEISFALEQGKVVIPVLYRDCIVPLQLQRNNRIDFRADYAKGLAQLLPHLQVTHPNQSVLDKAAQDDARRQAAWQAREAEAVRLHNVATQAPPDRPEPMEDPESVFQRTREEKLRQQKLEAEARQGDLIRQAQMAQYRAMQSDALLMAQATSRPPSEAPAPSKSGWLIAVFAFAATFLLVILWIALSRMHKTPGATPRVQPSTTAPAVSTTPQPPAPAPDPAATAALAKQGISLFNKEKYADALRPLTQACDQGDANACLDLAHMYLLQRGVKADLPKAATLYTKACSAGLREACMHVASQYVDGYGVPRDWPKALSLYLDACAHNNPPACANAGELYRKGGHGVASNPELGNQLEQKACTMGDSVTCEYLKYQDRLKATKQSGTP